MSADVVVIGAGLAGLCCARELAAAGLSVSVLEASDAVGGRVRTDHVGGFLLDRGFQVLLTAYPECRRVLDYDKLQLKRFYPGALVRFDGRFHRVADPWRAPEAAIPTLFSPIGSLADKFRIARLRASLAQYTIPELFERRSVSARERLAANGFSAAMIDRFFRPFFGGIFLEPELRTSSRMFDFVFRMLADGEITVPHEGMQAIPQQIADGLPSGTIELNRPVERLADVKAGAVVIATEEPQAARLLGAEPMAGARGVWCYYFAARNPPIDEPVIILNGDGTGPVNNCAVMTNVAPSYGDRESVLISATVLETAANHSENDVRAQMNSWFGAEALTWELIQRYEIRHAQPNQDPPALEPPERSVRLQRGLYICGDHRENASLNGAMHCGRRAAEAVIRDLES